MKSLKGVPLSSLAMGVLSGVGGFVDFGGIISYTSAGAPSATHANRRPGGTRLRRRRRRRTR